jgi:RimJ/RimL family protein N-acetyltransferase
VAWFKQTLGNPLRKVLIAEEGGRPIGTVRLDLKEENSFELSWAVAPTERGRGVAKQMVKLVVDGLGSRCSVTAEVKEGNSASASVAEAAGMTIARREAGLLFYTKPALLREEQLPVQPE